MVNKYPYVIVILVSHWHFPYFYNCLPLMLLSFRYKQFLMQSSITSVCARPSILFSLPEIIVFFLLKVENNYWSIKLCFYVRKIKWHLLQFWQGPILISPILWYFDRRLVDWVHCAGGRGVPYWVTESSCGFEYLSLIHISEPTRPY